MLSLFKNVFLYLNEFCLQRGASLTSQHSRWFWSHARRTAFKFTPESTQTLTQQSRRTSSCVAVLHYIWESHFSYGRLISSLHCEFISAESIQANTQITKEIEKTTRLTAISLWLQVARILVTIFIYWICVLIIQSFVIVSI